MDESVGKRVSVPTQLVELVSLVSLAFVSLIPLGSLVAPAGLGDRVDFDLGVAAGVGVRLVHLSLFTWSSMLILVSCSNPGGTTTLCSVGVGLTTVRLCFRGLRLLTLLGFLLELLEHFSMLLISTKLSMLLISIGPTVSSDSHGV